MRVTKFCKTSYELRQPHIRFISDTLTQLPKTHAFVSAKSTLQRQLRTMKDQWWENRAKELQSFTDCNESRSFYQSIKVVHHLSNQSTSQLLSKDGTSILTEKSEHLKRWQEHFHELLNRPGIITVAAVGRVHSQPILFELDSPTHWMKSSKPSKS